MTPDAVLQSVVGPENLLTVGSIAGDAVWQSPIGVAASERFDVPEWLDVDGREATADRELRAVLTEAQYQGLREAVEGLR